MKTTKLDVVNRQVAEKLIHVVRSGDFGKWVKDWYTNQPYTLSSNKYYTGGNQMFLSEEVQGKTSVYGTFNWFSKNGYKLRKGCKSTYSFFANKVVYDVVNKETNEVEKKQYFNYKVFQVFSVDDLEVGEDDRNKLLERANYGMNKNNTELIDYGTLNGMLNIVDCKLVNAGDPCYIPVLNQVVCPRIENFETSEGYYSAMFHELSHATMKKLGRYKSKGFERGGPDYAFEELVAELSSAMLCSHFGIQKDISKTASYLSSWEKHLDGKKIFSAVSKAMKSASLLLGKEDNNE